MGGGLIGDGVSPQPWREIDANDVHVPPNPRDLAATVPANCLL